MIRQTTEERLWQTIRGEAKYKINLPLALLMEFVTQTCSQRATDG